MVDQKVNTITLDKLAQKFADEGKTPMFAAVDGEAAGMIAVADTLKPEAQEAVESLQKMDIDVYMLTGDNEHTNRASGSFIATFPITRRTTMSKKRRRGLDDGDSCDPVRKK